MTNRTLTLGVVAALSMAGGQAYAQVLPCPSAPVLVTSLGPDFSCTEGGKTFSKFDIDQTNVNNTGATLAFGEEPGTFAVSLNRGSGSFIGTGTATVVFSFTVSTATRTGISGAASSTDAQRGTATGSVNAFSAMNGTDLLPTPMLNSANAVITFSPPESSVQVENGFLTHRGNIFTSMTSTFSVIEAAAPEPASLALFGLGLAGLALTRRRRS